jgi:hypothetical protein
MQRSKQSNTNTTTTTTNNNNNTSFKFNYCKRTCKFNSSEANYKVGMSMYKGTKLTNKQNTK